MCPVRQQGSKRAAPSLAGCGMLALMLTTVCACDAVAQQSPEPAPPPPPPSSGVWSWFDTSRIPFIPVPEIAADPDSGTTLGLLPVWLKTDEKHDIRQIIAPDVLHNPYFGYGAHARIYAYASGDEQWSLEGGIKERVEREFDAEYQIGRQREQRWSISYSAIFDRSGVPRFYGIGNNTHLSNQTNYTNSQELGQVQVGLNISHAWQLLYTARLQVVDVLPGTLSGVPSIESRFGRVDGLGTNRLARNRLSLIYDTRDDLTVPREGLELTAYGGMASGSGAFNDSMYTEAGFDGSGYWPVAPATLIAAHVGLRYLPSTHDVPFWALSSLGGGTSVTGGQGALRGFGEGRFYDRNSFSTTVELRRSVMSFDAISTHVDIEVAPFVDMGRVFSRSGTFPLDGMHQVYGLGFRGIARPFVVGHVDVGFGSEGVAVFTGLNYPF
jgi:outer membrane protein assembly factor BamA